MDPRYTIAKAFHEAYEALAPSHGYETREASAKPWEDVPEQNKNLMMATVGKLLADGTISQAYLVRPVWVRMTALPGPGAATLLGVAGLLDENGYIAKVLDGACEFVDVEDAAGANPVDSGLDWQEDEHGALLGPFFVPAVKTDPPKQEEHAPFVPPVRGVGESEDDFNSRKAKAEIAAREARADHEAGAVSAREKATSVWGSQRSDGGVAT